MYNLIYRFGEFVKMIEKSDISNTSLDIPLSDTKTLHPIRIRYPILRTLIIIIPSLGNQRFRNWNRIFVQDSHGVFDLKLVLASLQHNMSCPARASTSTGHIFGMNMLKSPVR